MSRELFVINKGHMKFKIVRLVEVSKGKEDKYVVEDDKGFCYSLNGDRAKNSLIDDLFKFEFPSANKLLKDLQNAEMNKIQFILNLQEVYHTEGKCIPDCQLKVLSTSYGIEYEEAIEIRRFVTDYLILRG